MAPLPALALAAALLAALPAAAATPDEDWNSDERNVTAWPTGGGFTLRSTRDSAEGQDEIIADYDAQAATLRVALQATAPAEATLGLRLGLRAVVEFVDADGDGTLGPGEEVVRRVPLPGTPAVADVEAVPGGGWRATSTHTLPASADAATGLTTSRLEVVVEASRGEAAGTEPTQLSVALRLLDGWARNGTHLALETEYMADDVPASVSADAARIRDEGLSLDTSWQDGQGTVSEGGDPRTVSFVRAQPAGHNVAFPLAVTAGWHPTTSGLSPPGGNVLLYVGAALVATAAIAYPAWRRLRA